MTDRDVPGREAERYREWLKERYPRITEAEIDLLLHHLVEIKRFINMIRYGNRPDTREYLQ